MEKKIKYENIRLFMKILNYYIHSLPWTETISSESFGELCYLAKIHSLMPILYDVLKPQLNKLPADDTEKAQLLKNRCMAAIAQAVHQEISREELQDVFGKHGLILVFFKGAQIRAFYPVPELRTMGDMDCLIKAQDQQKAHKLMLQLGYVCKINEGNVWVYQRGTVVIEMHTLIAGNGIGNKFNYEAFFQTQ